jgi:hypothetical protein
MSISLICSCGARLEIDAKFAGQTIACPDCHKPLTATLPKVPVPPRRTSGLALTSLLLAIIGAFTVVGTVAAVVVGAIAYRRIPQQPGVGGRRLAKAGMILGGVFTLVALTAFTMSNLFGLDGLLRQYHWASKLDFPPELTILKESGAYLFQRPSARWGVFKLVGLTNENDLAMLVEPRADAQLLWMADKTIHPDDDAFSLRAKALDIFRGSELVRQIGKLPEPAEAALQERDVSEHDKEQEFFVDAALGGIPRTFLFRLKRSATRLDVVVAGARKERFAQLEPMLAPALKDLVKLEASR